MAVGPIHFGFGGFGDDHESRDDVARLALEAACEHLQSRIAMGDVWVIGDTLNDIRCARAIGANVIAVATGDTPASELADAEPDLLLDDLRPNDRLLSLIE